MRALLKRYGLRSESNWRFGRMSKTEGSMVSQSARSIIIGWPYCEPREDD